MQNASSESSNIKVFKVAPGLIQDIQGITELQTTVTARYLWSPPGVQLWTMFQAKAVNTQHMMFSQPIQKLSCQTLPMPARPVGAGLVTAAFAGRLTEEIFIDL